MIIYILKSASCLAMLLAFYHLVLEKEKMHVFNRFYLLGSVLFSFLAPLYIIYIDGYSSDFRNDSNYIRN
jgi:bla regulator protein BlaR1